MKWLALPQSAYEQRAKLGEAFRCEQCPMLVIIDPQGDVVTTEGTEIVGKDTDGNHRRCCLLFAPFVRVAVARLESMSLSAVSWWCFVYAGDLGVTKETRRPE